MIFSLLLYGISWQEPLRPSEPRFEKQVLTREFVAEGCCGADFDRDGHVDVAAGRYLWFGPDFAQRTAYTAERENAGGPSKTPYDAATGYSDYFLAFAHDFDGDGWTDLLIYGLPGEPALVYRNPQRREGLWEAHAIFDVPDGESPDLLDLDGDKKPELLVHTSGPLAAPDAPPGTGGRLGYASIDWKQPFGKARFYPITERTPENDRRYFRYTHGYGAGDVNGDGRVDLLRPEGWFEQPSASSEPASEPRAWPFHAVPFGPPGARGGAQMHAFDVNGDGRNDVVTTYDAHGYGLGWFEQRADGSFVEHVILSATKEESVERPCFSQLHALAVADMNGDGLPDLVTGKRFWAHGPSGDVDPGGPAVLYWFELRREGEGRARFVPHLIDDDSGVGTQVSALDVNRDGKVDVLVANKKGVCVLRQR